MARRSRLVARREALGISQKALARMVGCGVSTVRRWEHGESEPLGYQRGPLADVIDVPLDRLDWYLAIHDGQSPPDVAANTLLACDHQAPGVDSFEDVDRRDLIRGSAAFSVITTVAPVVARSAMLDPPPSRVTAADVTQVWSTRDLLSGMSFSQGGGSIGLHDATSLLGGTARLLDGECPAALRLDLCTAVGALAAVVGFAAFDAGQPDEARRILRFALVCAEEAGNWNLRAQTLAADLAPVDLWNGNPDDGLTLVEQAQVRSDRLAPIERAMIWAARARAHALMGDVQSTLEAIGRADDEFSQGEPHEAPDMGWYSLAEHNSATGQALTELALTTSGHEAEAIARQLAAIAGFTDDYARSRAHARVRLATLQMATGDPAEAVGTANGVLPVVAELRSERARTLLAQLDHVCARHADRSDVVDLQHRLAEIA